MKLKKLIGKALMVLIGALLLFYTLFPVYWLIAMAVRPTGEMQGRIPLFPQSFTPAHFQQLFAEKGFGRALINSAQVTGVSLFFSMVFGLCAAYVLTRRRFRFGLKEPLNYWVLMVRILPPVAFTIPLYTVFNRLGILNTRLPAILACILIASLALGGRCRSRQAGRQRHRRRSDHRSMAGI